MRRAAAAGDGFELPGGPSGVLLLHGFRGSAAELRPLAERLREGGGFHVLAPCLPGHGAAPEALRGVRRADWERAVAEAFDAVRGRCERAAIVGFSMGAVLGARLAAERPADVAALVALAPGLVVPGVPLALGRAMLRLPLATALVRARTARLHPDLRDPAARATYGGYPWAPREARAELFDLIRAARRDLARVRAPTLILHAAQDHIVPLRAARLMHERLGSARKELRVLSESYHLLHLDLEREAAVEAILDFLKREGL